MNKLKTLLPRKVLASTTESPQQGSKTGNCYKITEDGLNKAPETFLLVLIPKNWVSRSGVFRSVVECLTNIHKFCVQMPAQHIQKESRARSFDLVHMRRWRLDCSRHPHTFITTSESYCCSCVSVLFQHKGACANVGYLRASRSP